MSETTHNVENKEDVQSTTTQKPKLTKKENLMQMLKFVLFSISAGVIQIILTEGLVLVGLKDKLYWIAYLVGLVASVVWNFTFNRKFTFKSANNIPLAMTLVAVFYAVFTPLSTWWGHLLTVKANWPEILVTAFNMIINFVLEFLYDRFVVFRNSINTNDLAKKKEDSNEQPTTTQTEDNKPAEQENLNKNDK